MMVAALRTAVASMTPSLVEKMLVPLRQPEAVILGRFAPSSGCGTVPAHQFHVATSLTRGSIVISVQVASYPLYAGYLDMSVYWARNLGYLNHLNIWHGSLALDTQDLIYISNFSPIGALLLPDATDVLNSLFEQEEMVWAHFMGFLQPIL